MFLSFIRWTSRAGCDAQGGLRSVSALRQVVNGAYETDDYILLMTSRGITCCLCHVTEVGHVSTGRLYYIARSSTSAQPLINSTEWKKARDPARLFRLDRDGGEISRESIEISRDLPRLDFTGNVQHRGRRTRRLRCRRTRRTVPRWLWRGGARAGDSGRRPRRRRWCGGEPCATVSSPAAGDCWQPRSGGVQGECRSPPGQLPRCSSVGSSSTPPACTEYLQHAYHTHTHVRARLRLITSISVSISVSVSLHSLKQTDTTSVQKVHRTTGWAGFADQQTWHQQQSAINTWTVQTALMQWDTQY